MWYTFNQRNIVSQLRFNFKISLNKGVSLPVCYFSVKLVSSWETMEMDKLFFEPQKKGTERGFGFPASISLPTR